MMTTKAREMVERLREADRGSVQRALGSRIFGEAADLIEALSLEAMEPSEGMIDHVLRYGGRCRECADNFGICEHSGLPCNPDEGRKAIRHVIEAANHYRMMNAAPTEGWQAPPPVPKLIEAVRRALSGLSALEEQRLREEFNAMLLVDEG